MTSVLEKSTDATARWVDDRLGSSNFVRRSLNKVFPDHWSFMLGEIALYTFIILLLTGTYLGLFYDGLDPRGHLQRQLRAPQGHRDVAGVRVDAGHQLRRARRPAHAADPPLGGAAVHGVDRRAPGPRLLHRRVPQAARDQLGHRRPAAHPGHRRGLRRLLAAGRPALRHRRPHRLLDRDGDPGGRHLDGVPRVRRRVPRRRDHRAPVRRPHLPGPAGHPGPDHLPHDDDLVPEAHPVRGPRAAPRTTSSAAGCYPAYAAKAGGFFFLVFAVLAALGGLAQINPIWLYGPYDPSQVSAGSQPDWYVGFLDGSTRLMPNWEFRGLGHTIPFNVLVPTVVLPGPDLHRADRLPVDRGPPHRRPGVPQPARPAPRRPGPHRHRRDVAELLRHPDDLRRQRHHRPHLQGERELDDLRRPGRAVHRPAAGLRAHQADLLRPAAQRRRARAPRHRVRHHPPAAVGRVRRGDRAAAGAAPDRAHRRRVRPSAAGGRDRPRRRGPAQGPRLRRRARRRGGGRQRPRPSKREKVRGFFFEKRSDSTTAAARPEATLAPERELENTVD